jgi:hypothetical protein
MVRILAAASLLAFSIAACGAPSLSFKQDDPNGSATGGSAGATGVDGGGAGAGEWSTDGSSTDDGDFDASESVVGRMDARIISCANQIVDGDESDVDCGGGSCPLCTIGRGCRQDTDCIGAYCKQGACAQASCIDKVKNLRETDIDCGGGDCPPCGVGANCDSPVDCAAQSCIADKCQAVACDDHLLGPAETDIDCGGSACAPCATGKSCLVPRDCASGVCGGSLVCVAPSCSDGVQNGSETGQDCGGSCAPCVDGAGCTIGGDCASGVCASRLCQAPSCTDRVKNQGEGDVDCGGSCAKCGTDAACGKDGDCLSGNCSVTCQLCPRDMVRATSAGGPYCIDATEVTVGAYNEFLVSNPPLSLMGPSCAGKTSYAPVNIDLSQPLYPVTWVDWCDAFAYCTRAGRHLCGRIGGGAVLSGVEATDAAKSEWHNACSKGGLQAYPYGATYSQVCDDNQTGVLVPVGAFPFCVGGFPGLHDMSGNVQEWEDNCSVVGTAASLKDTCKMRGGGYADGSSGVTCGAMTVTRKRSQADSATGFRCCR